MQLTYCVPWLRKKQHGPSLTPALRTIWGIQLARAMDWFAARDSQLRENGAENSCRD
jgi:hypothetical protein